MQRQQRTRQTKVADFNLARFDYDLPERLIAQRPLENREASRLMVLAQDKAPILATFAELAAFLPQDSLIVANNSRVVPARIHGHRGSRGKVELVLLSPVDLLQACATGDAALFAEADVLLRPARALRTGERLFFPELQTVVLEKEGRCRVKLEWKGGTLADILSRHGVTPLPPYIRRPPNEADAERYQTVYASESQRGSVAAPTVGLHFTPRLRRDLFAAGHDWCELTLFVGYGTFSPIRYVDIRDHVMHAEYVRIPETTALAIQKAMQRGRPIIAVGTTSLRTIEGVIHKCGSMEPWEGWLDTYIYPGFPFRAITGLITNFHLPKSSLLVLVSALAGRERILSAYRKAVEEKMRFFSYGDAMFIQRT